MFFPVERNIELWFAMVLTTTSTLSSGGVTFGDSLCLSDSSQYWPMPDNGFHTVAYGDLPKVSGPPSNSVVSFYGQCAMGRLGVTNHTDGTIEVTLVSHRRRFTTESCQ